MILKKIFLFLLILNYVQIIEGVNNKEFNEGNSLKTSSDKELNANKAQQDVQTSNPKLKKKVTFSISVNEDEEKGKSVEYGNYEGKKSSGVTFNVGNSSISTNIPMKEIVGKTTLRNPSLKKKQIVTEEKQKSFPNSFNMNQTKTKLNPQAKEFIKPRNHFLTTTTTLNSETNISVGHFPSNPPLKNVQGLLVNTNYLPNPNSTSFPYPDPREVEANKKRLNPEAPAFIPQNNQNNYNLMYEQPQPFGPYISHFGVPQSLHQTNFHTGFDYKPINTLPIWSNYGTLPGGLPDENVFYADH
ncbi:hypothetical protein Mgra_00003871 [Meloidogyne graminicola]|uniref:Uncharacterized protein n=1 Tax=Meloidogyne graminicola TaxID=189291 RepID=A0A8S9ZUM0_9BILA|nr:hypothetical protein Mgra_00003871 [Meloidogyne graminicola]